MIFFKIQGLGWGFEFTTGKNIKTLNKHSSVLFYGSRKTFGILGTHFGFCTSLFLSSFHLDISMMCVTQLPSRTEKSVSKAAFRSPPGWEKVDKSLRNKGVLAGGEGSVCIVS